MEDSINNFAEINGVKIIKVKPNYTSQCCSKCGYIDKLSRNGNQFICVSCGYEIDADKNAAININNMGSLESPVCKLKDIYSKFS